MPQVTSPPNVIDQPLVSFGREICGDLDAALRREWLVTNGLGGYASGTVAGILTRRYHGMLVAALSPPVQRTVLVGGLVEWASYAGKRYPLSTHEYLGGTIDPQGYKHVQSFALEGSLPVWVFAVGYALVERRVWMANGANTTYVRYRLLRGSGPVELEITPLVIYRDFHALSSGQGWGIGVEPRPRGAAIHAFDGATPYYLLADVGQFTPVNEWFWNFYHREEAARGLESRGDLYAAGTFNASLDPGGQLTLALSTDEGASLDGNSSLSAEQDRQRDLLRLGGVGDEAPALQQLTLAADQFIVRREMGGSREAGPTPNGASGAAGKTIIAGYHWFNDWGRDTMISLPGLTCTTGRPADAAEILRDFAQYVQDGLLPNNFPDRSGAIPGYNTVDATLWYFLAVRIYEQTTNDMSLLNDVLPVLREMADRHIQGTRYHIGVDPSDGLLRAGEPGVQLTWMDAKIGDWVVTPRTGKPVEINALWYNALWTLAEALEARRDAAAATYREHAERARASFSARFFDPERGYLADVVDGPDGDDWTMRPNQIFAVSLPIPLVDGDIARQVVDAVGRDLLTSYGLRSLSPDDPAYVGTYIGGPRQRDSIYHQGPVWTWLQGPYAVAHYRVYKDINAALGLLSPFKDHLCDAGLGSISEIMEGDPPHRPRGCIAQAWGVAETLRVWRELTQVSAPAVEEKAPRRRAPQRARA